MPVSRVRRKKSQAYIPPPSATGRRKRKHSPAWFGALVLFLLVFGVVWLVTFYVTNGAILSGLGNGNLLVGFAFIAAGFGLATQWR